MADISEDIATALAGTISHVHLGDVFAVEGMFSPRMLSFLRSCQGRGISISMDACWDPTGKWRESLDPFLELVNYLFFNEEEGMHFFGRTTDDSLLSLLSLGPSIVCLKQGAKGARAAVAGRILVAEAAPGLPVVDTTGAGDALVGAFLGSLLRGSSADVALEVGVKVGTLAVFQFGGCSEIPPTLIEKVLADALAEHSKGLKLIESNNG